MNNIDNLIATCESLMIDNIVTEGIFDRFKGERKNKITAVPNKSVGEIKFGMKRPDVREFHKGKYKEFKKNKQSTNTTDKFDNYYVFYNSSDVVVGVEITGNIEISIRNTIVYPGNINSLMKLDNRFKKDGSSLINEHLSIGVIVNDDDSISSIMFGEKDYYIK